MRLANAEDFYSVLLVYLFSAFKPFRAQGAKGPFVGAKEDEGYPVFLKDCTSFPLSHPGEEGLHYLLLAGEVYGFHFVAKEDLTPSTSRDKVAREVGGKGYIGRRGVSF